MAVNAERTLMLYDGVCGLCDFGVQFILSRDKRDHFQFAALQTDLAAEVLARHGLDAKEMATFYIVDGVGTEAEVVRDRSRACLRVLSRLGGGYRVLGAIAWVVPRFVLDGLYRAVSANRYRMFGKRDACRLPTPGERLKFVGD